MTATKSRSSSPPSSAPKTGFPGAARRKTAATLHRQLSALLKFTTRRPLPCVGLFLCAITGILAAEALPPSPSSPALTATASALLLLPALLRRGNRLLFAAGVACAFAALRSAETQWNPGQLLLQAAPAREQTPATFQPPTAPAFKATIQVTDDPIQFGNTSLFPARLLRGEFAGAPHPIQWPVPLWVRWQGPPPSLGDILQGTGRLIPPRPARNPGEFDQRTWLARQGITALWNVPSPAAGEITQPSAAPWWRIAIASTRAAMLRGIQTGLDQKPEIAALLAAMSLGEINALPQPLLDSFRATGTLHLFSVSGLHVGMVGVMLWALLRAAKLPQHLLVPAVCFGLFFYAALAGWRPAGIRAAFMAAVMLAALLLPRPATPLNSMSAAGLILLAVRPSLLFHPGFQLSFAVVAAILLLSGPLERLLRRPLMPDPFLPSRLYHWRDHLQAALAKYLASLAAVSWSAWLGSFPFILAHYQIISFSALLANLWAVPLAFPCLALALAAGLTGLLSLPAAAFLNHINAALCGTLITSITAASNWPLSSLRLPPHLEPPPAIAILDNSPGASTLFFTPGGAWLADTGSAFQWQHTTRRTLDHYAVPRVTAILLTHGDANHIGGAAEAIRQTQPARLITGPFQERSPTWRRAVAAAKESPATSVITAAAGTAWQLSPDTTLHTLAPPETLRSPHADDRALILRWQAPGASLLLLGDAGIGLQDWLLTNCPPHLLQADVLVMGRPASGELPRASLLLAIQPRAIIITDAPFPRTERHTPLWQQTLELTQAKIYLQSRHGALLLRPGPRNTWHLQSWLQPRESLTWSPSPAQTNPK